MGRDIINNIICGKCHKEFNVATEDIEWGHIRDAGETEEEATIHDFFVSQTIDCPHCCYANKIVMHAKGKDAGSLDGWKIISLEYPQ